MEISASAPASALLFQVLAAVKLEIFKLNSGKCSLLQLVDSRLTEVITSTGAEITMVVPNLDNLTDASNFAAPQKLARLCSVLIIDTTSKLQELLAPTTEEEPEEDEDTSKKDWPQASFPGCPYNCYHIFVAHSNGSIDEDQVFRFAQTTRRVRHAYFVVYDRESVGIFTRSPNGENLYTIAKLKPEDDAPAFSLKILRPNFQGIPMIVNVCAKCGDGLEMFQRTNVWFFFFEAIVYELSLSINTTLQFEKLAAPQRDGPDEDGDWDAWKSPLLDGSAAIAGFQHYSIPALKVLHYTRPVVSTYALFITAKPKRVYGSDKLSSLLSPLSLKVWIGSCLSVVALYVAIELTLHVHRFSEFQKLIQMYVPTASIPNLSTAEKSVFKKMLPRHVHYSALVELVKPWIGQGGISVTFERNVANDSVAKFLLGIWLLILNVLGSAYQSELTSCVVSPEYTRPPTTFRELAESKFTPFAIIWADNLANDFGSLKNNYSRKLLETTREFEYFAKDVIFPPLFQYSFSRCCYWTDYLAHSATSQYFKETTPVLVCTVP